MSKSLILVDLQYHAEGGHFATWLRKAVSEACKCWRHIVIYTADPIPESDLGVPESYDGSINHFTIGQVHSTTEHKGDIMGVLARHQERCFAEMGKPPFFIMWAQQHTERARLHRQRWFRRLPKRKTEFDRPWGSLFSLSTLVYEDPQAKTHPLEARLKMTIDQDSSCSGIMVWDENAATQFHPKCIHLPDVEVLLGDDLWSGPINRSPVLGSVGQLWGYRSMNLLAEILESEPKIHGFAAGSLFPKSYSKSAKRMVSRQGERFSLERGFVPDDAALHQAICRMDGFVLDSRSYKAPSGLAIRAMAAGRPIVTIDCDSWIARHVKASGVGVFWQKGRGSLHADLREWFESGGPARSKALAEKLSDQAGMEAAFAEMFRRLKEAAAEN
jgi:glycosyltransferase involved in cell wall biosynthesis